MVATFSWVEFNTNATDTSVATNLNFGSTNAANLATSTYPITAGTYSYSKWIKPRWTGTFTRIENLQFWASDSGPLVTGETMNCSASTEAGYDGTTLYAAPTTNAEAKGGTMVSVPVADPTTANVGFTGSLSASLTNSSPGYSDFIVLQVQVTGAASAGATNQKTFTLQYDEV